jgi:hypothetical protein
METAELMNRSIDLINLSTNKDIIGLLLTYDNNPTPDLLEVVNGVKARIDRVNEFTDRSDEEVDYDKEITFELDKLRKTAFYAEYLEDMKSWGVDNPVSRHLFFNKAPIGNNVSSAYASLKWKGHKPGAVLTDGENVESITSNCYVISSAHSHHRSSNRSPYSVERAIEIVNHAEKNGIKGMPDSLVNELVESVSSAQLAFLRNMARTTLKGEGSDDLLKVIEKRNKSTKINMNELPHSLFEWLGFENRDGAIRFADKEQTKAFYGKLKAVARLIKYKRCKEELA